MTRDNGSGCTKTKLSVCSFGFAIGFAEAVYMFVFALAGLYWGYGTAMIQEISGVFHGYAPTFVGSLYGAGWGFLDGFIFGVIAAYAYNWCFCCCKKWCGSDSK